MTGTDLALIESGEASPYELMRMTPAELQDLVGDALAPGETLGMGDLARVAWPGAGATTWEIPSSRGAQPTTEITGIVLLASTTRGYWRDKYSGKSGSDAQPDCRSYDGITGEGEPGGSCLDCPLNEFGTSVSESGDAGEGKACKERRVLFVLPRDGILPYVVSVPPGSLQVMKQYRVALMRERLNLQKVESSLKLEKVEKDGVPAHARLVIAQVGELDGAAVESVKEFTKLVAPSMQRAARDEANRTDDAPPPQPSDGPSETAGDLGDL